MDRVSTLFGRDKEFSKTDFPVEEYFAGGALECRYIVFERNI